LGECGVKIIAVLCHCFSYKGEGQKGAGLWYKGMVFGLPPIHVQT
jgi:hypothetical protein